MPTHVRDDVRGEARYDVRGDVKGDVRDDVYCETETFNATCADDEVILMTHARYGRMNTGRCVKMDYGHIGCASDVTSLADERCSGRRHCNIRIPDLQFTLMQPCPEDLKPYLEAGYTCMRGGVHDR